MNVTVKITKSAREKLDMMAQLSMPNEIGGVVVGFYDDGTESLEYSITAVLCITEDPTIRESCISTPHSFECTDGKKWAELALKAVKLYGLNYIGDWHSHTCSLSCTPFSLKDMKHIEKQLQLNQFASTPPLHLVVAGVSPTEILAFVAIPNVIICIKPEVIS